MLITRTPFRVSLCGGGSDVVSWFGKNEGLVVGGAISCYSYVSVRSLPPFHDYRTRVSLAVVESVKENLLIQNRVVNAAVRLSGWGEEGLEIAHSSDLPGRSGTGSSSTFAVGLLNALFSLKGVFKSKRELADLATHLERDMLGEQVGCQDQLMAAVGGFGTIRFKPSGITMEPLLLPPEKLADLEDHLLLFFTGQARTSSEIASKYYGSLGDQKDKMWALVRLAEQSVEAILRSDHQKLGDLIDRSFRIKCGLSDAVCPTSMSELYAAARLAGAWGGKLTGAGGGGSLLLVAPKEKRERIIESMEEKGAVHIPFRFEHAGTTVIHAERSR